MDIHGDTQFSQRVRMHIVQYIEAKAHRKVAINLLCLACAYLLNIKVDELFVCEGCEENQGNQLGHDCVMLSSNDKRDIHFDSALELVQEMDMNEKWRDLLISSSIPSDIIRNMMQEISLQGIDYVKRRYATKIRKFANKIDQTEVTLFH